MTQTRHQGERPVELTAARCSRTRLQHAKVDQHGMRRPPSMRFGILNRVRVEFEGPHAIAIAMQDDAPGGRRRDRPRRELAPVAQASIAPRYPRRRDACDQPRRPALRRCMAGATLVEHLCARRRRARVRRTKLQRTRRELRRCRAAELRTVGAAAAAVPAQKQ